MPKRNASSALGKPASPRASEAATSDAVASQAQQARLQASTLATAAEAQLINRIEREAHAAATAVAAITGSQDDRHARFTKEGKRRQLKANLAKRAEETAAAEAEVARAKALEDALQAAAHAAAIEASAMEFRQAAIVHDRKQEEEIADQKLKLAEKQAAQKAAAVEAKLRMPVQRKFCESKTEVVTSEAQTFDAERRRRVAEQQAAGAKQREARRVEAAAMLREAKLAEQAQRAEVMEKARQEATAKREAARVAAARLKEAKCAEEDARRQLKEDERREQLEEARALQMEKLLAEREAERQKTIMQAANDALGGSTSFAAKISRQRLKRASGRRSSFLPTLAGRGLAWRSSATGDEAGDSKIFSYREGGDGQYELDEGHRVQAERAHRQAQLGLLEKKKEVEARSKAASFDSSKFNSILRRAGHLPIDDDEAWRAFYVWSEKREPLEGMQGLSSLDPDEYEDIYVDFYDTVTCSSTRLALAAEPSPIFREDSPPPSVVTPTLMR